MENVKRLRTHDGGNTFKVIKGTLEDMGYEVHAQVLNAKNFGVPQNRERIYIIGFLGKTNFKFPEGVLSKKINLACVIVSSKILWRWVVVLITLLNKNVILQD